MRRSEASDRRLFCYNKNMKNVYQNLINLLLATLWAYFAYINIVAFLGTYKLTYLLFLLVQSEFVVLLLIRRIPVKSSKNPFDYLISILGTFAILLYRPSFGIDTHFLIGDILIYIGVVLEMIGFLSLNTSAGIIPANRGIKSGGMYRFVKHPIYMGYLILYTGYFLSNATAYNLFILLAVIAFQIMRINREEKILIKDEKYIEYSKKVKWKLIPKIY